MLPPSYDDTKWHLNRIIPEQIHSPRLLYLLHIRAIAIKKVGWTFQKQPDTPSVSASALSALSRVKVPFPDKCWRVWNIIGAEQLHNWTIAICDAHILDCTCTCIIRAFSIQHSDRVASRVCHPCYNFSPLFLPCRRPFLLWLVPQRAVRA